MKNYETFKDIEYDVKRLNLERQIAFEELKSVKNDIQDDLKPANWLQTIFKYAFKMGSFMVLKKMVK